MREIVIEIPGKPQGKARPRVVRNKYTGKAHGITPQNTLDYESLIRWAWKAAGGVDFGEALLDVHITAEFAIPKSYSKKRVREITENHLRPVCKPDLDNIQKVVLDALNGLAYRDDAQVVKISCEKKYAENGAERVVVNVSEMGGGDM